VVWGWAFLGLGGGSAPRGSPVPCGALGSPQGRWEHRRSGHDGGRPVRPPPPKPLDERAKLTKSLPSAADTMIQYFSPYPYQ